MYQDVGPRDTRTAKSKETRGMIGEVYNHPYRDLLPFMYDEKRYVGVIVYSIYFSYTLICNTSSSWLLNYHLSNNHHFLIHSTV